tara:strand:- start:24 stop:269 length:246 start_codon:yes stop_codon:yes gene_type:complete
MPNKPTSSRDYAKEYKDFHGKPEEIKRRSMRNKARRKKGLKKGDPREVDHKRPLSKGGTNSVNNLKIKSRSSNRKKGARDA